MKTVFPLIISNTDMSLLSMCELRWYRSRCQLLRREGFNEDLEAGGGFAKGMEVTRKAFYNDKLSSEDAIQLGYEHILTKLNESMGEDSSNFLKSPERMALALKMYFKRWPLENADVKPIELVNGTSAVEHKIVVELPILHPELGVPLLYKCRLDMLAFEMGRIYTVDEKTCKSFSENEGNLLPMSGQFIGQAWAASKLANPVEIRGAKVRKVAIQKTDIKLKEFEYPITEFMIEQWEHSFLTKLYSMVEKYHSLLYGVPFENLFTKDYGLGCTAYYKPCEFSEGCLSTYGEKFLASNFDQIAWDAEDRKEIGIDDYRKLLGLEGKD